jgi:Cu(I)/Ag(I) efflux system membrane fusion protein
MTISKTLAIAGLSMLTLMVAIAVFFMRSADDNVPPYDERYSWFESGPFEIGIAVIPDTPRVGENDLLVALRLPSGGAATGASISAYAEMAAMGSMSAMRAPADLAPTSVGQFKGSLDLRMRGAWPLSISVEDPVRGDTQLSIDLATDRPGLLISSGGRPMDMPDIGESMPMDHGENGQNGNSISGNSATGGRPAIIVDSRRRQMIGLETEIVRVHKLSRRIRAIGNVTYDERRLTTVSLKFDAWIGELNADYVGASVLRGQKLFSVYSPELLAAQQEYLEAHKRLSRRSSDDSLVRAARQRLRLWDLSEQEIAALENRGTPLEYVPIYSPASGIIVAKHIDSGSATKTGQALLQIADLSQVWIEAELYGAELDVISEGMSANVSLPYLPGQSFAARVEYIYPYLDKTSRTGRIRITLDNSAGALRPDMYAEVHLSADLGDLLAVPEDAVLFAGESRVVFVDLGDGRLQPLKIKTGQRAMGMIEVTDGLSQGDVIVTSGNFLIAAEAKLKLGIDQW